jgi:hypothetical protein
MLLQHASDATFVGCFHVERIAQMVLVAEVPRPPALTP